MKEDHPRSGEVECPLHPLNVDNLEYQTSGPLLPHYENPSGGPVMSFKVKGEWRARNSGLWDLSHLSLPSGC